jgi:putative DNA primase/helicase
VPCPPPGPCVKLARASETDCIIELLARSVILVPGGNPQAHPTGRPYVYRWGHLAIVQTITPDEREQLLAAARSFDRVPPEPRRRPSEVQPRTAVAPEPAPDWLADIRRDYGPPTWRPGDDFNARGTWEEVLEPLGWAVDHAAGGATYWTRPGKGRGVSASTGYCGDSLYVFTSDTSLEPDRAYDKFAAYTHLHCGGDFARAAKELARLGYGRASSALKPHND